MTNHKITHDLEEIKKQLAFDKILKKDILTLEEAALYLGISKSTLYKKVCTGTIPSYKPGNKLRYFRRIELENWVLNSNAGINTT